MHRLLLNLDKLSIDHDLVELRFHGREELVQNIAEREIRAVPLKESPPDLIVSGAIKNQLRSGHLDAVGYIAQLSIRGSWYRRWAGPCLNSPGLRCG